MSYTVAAEPAVSDDLRALALDEPAAAREAIRLLLELRDNPWLGDELRERYNLRVLGDCRRLRFDDPARQDKPRYRIVYRNEPADGAPDLVRVWAIDPRRDLAAYAQAAARATRAQARPRKPRPR